MNIGNMPVHPRLRPLYDYLVQNKRMSDLTRPGGDVLTWEELQELSPAQRNQVLSELMSVRQGVGEYLDRNEYEGIYRDQFRDYFEAGTS